MECAQDRSGIFNVMFVRSALVQRTYGVYWQFGALPRQHLSSRKVASIQGLMAKRDLAIYVPYTHVNNNLKHQVEIY